MTGLMFNIRDEVARWVHDVLHHRGQRVGHERVTRFLQTGQLVGGNRCPTCGVVYDLSYGKPSKRPLSELEQPYRQWCDERIWPHPNNVVRIQNGA